MGLCRGSLQPVGLLLNLSRYAWCAAVLGVELCFSLLLLCGRVRFLRLGNALVGLGFLCGCFQRCLVALQAERDASKRLIAGVLLRDLRYIDAQLGETLQ